MNSRRDFLKHLSMTATSVGLTTLPACATPKKQIPKDLKLTPTREDNVILTAGLNYRKLISWGDIINNNGDRFGFNNDYIEYIQKSRHEIIMWVNHEYIHSIFIHGNTIAQSRLDVDKERYNVGGSIIHLIKKNDEWVLKIDSDYNRRITGETDIPIVAKRPIAGKRIAQGTLGNCAGGKTPWNTFLTCEENYHLFYGEHYKDGRKKKSHYGWEKYYQNSPLHYGWVVEINPITGHSKKLTSIGRFAHECSTCYRKTKKSNVIVYSGDDKNDEHLYRFISSSSDSLDNGELFVANVEKGEWISLDIEKHKILKDNFKDQLEVNTFCREASKMVGASPLDRPEDIEIHPDTKDVYICLTNNKKHNRPHGKILRISYKNNNHYSSKFVAEDFVIGGVESGFSSPDNLVFDKNGNIWMTSDISGSKIGKGPYKTFGNNGLFYIPTKGNQAGQAIQLASAPKDAEFTGPCFSPDEKTLFLSVQHPGEKSKSLKKLTSHWPSKDGIPKPSVIQITGPTLDLLTKANG